VRTFDQADMIASTTHNLHMQSLGALLHYTSESGGAYSYEQAIQAIRRLGWPVRGCRTAVFSRRFNLMARNHERPRQRTSLFMDSTRSMAVIAGLLTLPILYNPKCDWTFRHQMSLKRQTHGVENAIDLLRLRSLPESKQGGANNCSTHRCQRDPASFATGPAARSGGGCDNA